MKKSGIFISILISGICWYFSFDLSGDFWYLLWVAPIPVLIVSLNMSARQSFVIAFVAYLIGRLSWLSYLLTVLPVILAIVFTILLPLIFALVVVASRKIVLKQNAWAVFAFPVLCCLFEWLFFIFSGDGTAGSIAYCEANFLPLIQVASVTGILGISFLVTLFPSVAALIITRKHSKKLPMLIALLFIIVSLSFGIIRMNSNTPAQNSVIAGLAVVDEKFHAETNHPKAGNEILLANMYANEIKKLAQQGAQVVVLPEKMINLKDGFADSLKSIIVNSAKNNHTTVVAGYTEFMEDSSKHNNAWVISGEGNVLADYRKVNLFEGEAMNNFISGKEIATFNLFNIPSGTAICKDMDYGDFIRKYSVAQTQILYVPAWDFIQDGWMHSRMAVLRAVENGCALVRTARQGRLTISDYSGKVLYETSCENNQAASLIGKINLTATQTIYSHFGNWFAYLNLIAALYFLMIFLFNKRKAK
ncbi:MAG TPA: nitrilase-related carbon-nitrogen hydrolase [Panacibacter sp.]|nr:nitrilase-related carbon-nitrogen hydrolase [Panacibacter sp.]